MKNSISKWIYVVSWLICLLGFFVGISLYTSPQTFIKDVDFSVGGVRYLANMWAARQISISGIIGISLFRKSATMLQISFFAYVLMNIQDAFIGLSKGDLGLTIGAIIFTILPGFMAFKLNRSN